MTETAKLRRRCLLFMLCLFASTFAFSGESSMGQEADNDAAADESVANWQRYYRDVAKEYGLQISDDALRELVWVEKPVLTYTNPVRGRQQHGAIFVWTDRGRPAAMASIWSMMKPRSPDIRLTAHELVSLSSLNLVATRPSPETLRAGVDPQWAIEDALIKWSDLEMPARRGGKLTASRASLEMRRLARRFRAELVTRSDRSLNQLRMLETPVFQYESESKDRIGGLFAFVLATDPELFLWLEYQRPTDSKTAGKWRYAPVRMSLLELKLYLDETLVWTDLDQKDSPSAAYNVTFRVREFPADQPPTSE